MSPWLLSPAFLLRKSDEELARLAAAGHDAAFSAIVLRHRAALLRHCRSLLRDQRAEDAVQQTFVRALQSLRQGTEVRDLRPWLHRIARNVALTELGTRQSQPAELSEEWEDRSRSDEYERRANLRETLLAVQALPDRQRTALLRSVAGASPSAIAHELGVTTMAARQLVHRARVSVRAAARAVCPPPLVWLVRRLASAWERVPRAAGVPAGAAPVASKVALVVVASATVAAPVTVLHGVLTHHPAAGHARRAAVVRSQPAIAVAPPATGTSPSAVASVPAPTPQTTAASSRPPSATAPPPAAKPDAGQGSGVSASSPNGVPVGGGSRPGNSSAGGPAASAAAVGPGGSAGAGSGPVATDSASSPTYPSSTDSSASSGASSDSGSASASSAGSSPSGSATNPGGSPSGDGSSQATDGSSSSTSSSAPTGSAAGTP